MARLKELFVKEIKPNLKQQFGYKNHYMVPQIQKIVLNMGLGIDGNDAKVIKSSQEDLAAITGQKPIVTKFRKSISNFTLDPSFLWIPFLTLTTTALWTEPFFTLPFGIASFTATTIVSPILAYLLFEPPSTFIHSIFILPCFLYQ